MDADFITRCTDEEYEKYKQERGWCEVSVKDQVHQALKDTELFGPCFLYGTDDQDRRLLMQLRERRVQRQLQKEIGVAWPLVRVMEWSAAGRRVKDFEEVAGQLGAQIDGQAGGSPLILCATLGVDSQGRQLCRVIDTASEIKAWIAVVEGPPSSRLGARRTKVQTARLGLCDSGVCDHGIRRGYGKETPVHVYQYRRHFARRMG